MQERQGFRFSKQFAADVSQTSPAYRSLKGKIVHFQRSFTIYFISVNRKGSTSGPMHFTAWYRARETLTMHPSEVRSPTNCSSPFQYRKKCTHICFSTQKSTIAPPRMERRLLLPHGVEFFPKASHSLRPIVFSFQPEKGSAPTFLNLATKSVALGTLSDNLFTDYFLPLCELHGADKGCTL